MFIEDYPDNIIGVLFRILHSFMIVTQDIINYLFSTPGELIESWLNHDLPEWLATYLTKLVEIYAKGFMHFTLFDLMVGSALILILVVGIVKYFGDLVGL